MLTTCSRLGIAVCENPSNWIITWKIQLLVQSFLFKYTASQSRKKCKVGKNFNFCTLNIAKKYYRFHSFNLLIQRMSLFNNAGFQHFICSCSHSSHSIDQIGSRGQIGHTFGVLRTDPGVQMTRQRTETHLWHSLPWPHINWMLECAVTCKITIRYEHKSYCTLSNAV